MSIYISGMEMPVKCALCDAAFPDGVGWSCPLIKGRPNIDNQKGRRKDCPLVPVPLHGRLGDLDALEKILKEKQAKYKARDLLATHELSEAMRMGFDAAVGHVLMAPTIIPAEGGDK